MDPLFVYVEYTDAEVPCGEKFPALVSQHLGQWWRWIGSDVAERASGESTGVRRLLLRCMSDDLPTDWRCALNLGSDDWIENMEIRTGGVRRGGAFVWAEQKQGEIEGSGGVLFGEAFQFYAAPSYRVWGKGAWDRQV
jgi:hypothetical protein